MQPMNPNEVTLFVEENIGSFHRRRAESLKKLKLIDVLKRKNPYLFKAKNVTTANELVQSILDAHLSSQEEAIFGEFLEQLAIFVCQKAYNGVKSSAEGIDLEFIKDDSHYLVAIKSGPNWGNSSQIKKMEDNFKKAKRVLRTSSSKINTIAVNGCCYGRRGQPDKGEYFKYCGKDFWELISGNERLYIEIIEPLGYQARQRNEEFQQEYGKIINLFSKEFLDRFCPQGEIDWEALVKFNSGPTQD